MSAQPQEVDQEVSPATGLPGPKRVQALIAISADQLRRLSVRRQFRGYHRDDIDYAIGRAAQTIDDLADELLKVYAEVGTKPELRGVDAGMAARPESPAPLDLQSSSVERSVTDVLETAHRVAESVIRTAHEERDRILEQAELDAEPLREEITRRRASLVQLQGDSDALVERAQLLANTLLDAARGERDRLLSSTVDDIEKHQTALESERVRLAAAVTELRNTRPDVAGLLDSFLDGVAADWPEEPGPESPNKGTESGSTKKAADQAEQPTRPEGGADQVDSDLQSRIIASMGKGTEPAA